MVSYVSLTSLADDESTSSFIQDDDDTMALENYEDFLSDEGHLVNELLNNRSWMKDESIVSEVEDDELEMEMNMLSLAEQEVSQEISNLMQSLRDQPGLQNQLVQPKKHLSASPIHNNDINNRSERERNAVYEEKRAETIEEATKVLTRRKVHTQISNIHEIKIDKAERDARESMNESQPSDEACFSVYDICSRDPPEEILFIHEDESEDEGYSHFTGEIVHHMATSVEEAENSNGSIEVNSVNDEVVMDELDLVELYGEDGDLGAGQFDDLEMGRNNMVGKQAFVGDIINVNTSLNDAHVEKNNETYSLNERSDRIESSQSEEHVEEDVLSVWDMQSGQLSAAELGKNNLFEEEIFWEESFWKTPVHKNCATRDRKSDHNTRIEKKSTAYSAQKPRRSIVDILSLPTLEHPGGNTKGDIANRDRRSVQSLGGESIIRSTGLSVYQVRPTEIENEEESVCQESRQISEDAINNLSLISTEVDGSRSYSPLDPSVRIDQETDITEAKLGESEKHSCDFRRVIIAVHVLLILIGIVLGSFFFLTDS
mmetsp:Transcript_28467/g.77090  ORF Transcript_28467/g.77090 Transcript_28467/m.77090 type:complete len:544 (+) Transcript_28467:151-1782(+)